MQTEWLRTYGSAIGPTIGFFFGICALYVKAWFDRRQRHQRSQDLLEQFVTLALVEEPPLLLEVPTEQGYEMADKARGNVNALKRYHHRLLTAKSFVDANEKYIVEDAPMQVLERLGELLLSIIDNSLDLLLPSTQEESLPGVRCPARRMAFRFRLRNTSILDSIGRYAK